MKKKHIKKTRLRSQQFFCCLIFSFLFSGCTSKTEKQQTKKEINSRKQIMNFYNSYIVPAQNQKENKIKNLLNSMPLEEKIGQLFIINLEGNTKFRSYETYEKITGNKKDSDKPLIAGGYLFFSYNLCQTPQQQRDFVQTIHDYCIENNQIKPFLATDQEGGWVNRLKKLTGGLPSQQKVSETYNIYEAYDLYSDQAKKMIDLGFTMNLAPVAEICTEDNKEFLDGRSFGSLEQVCEYGGICINAYENNGIATVIKHFPGNSNTDPHFGLPYITSDKEELMDSILSFKKMIEKNPSAVLMSHAITKAVDDGVPACLSRIWCTDILRNEFGFKGIIFSDDIFMGALNDNGYPPEKACVAAIEAGVDCIMISEKRFSKPARILYNKAKEDENFLKRIEESCERIVRYKIENNILELSK